MNSGSFIDQAMELRAVELNEIIQTDFSSSSYFPVLSLVNDFVFMRAFEEIIGILGNY